jgi:hypothetical protein
MPNVSSFPRQWTSRHCARVDFRLTGSRIDLEPMVAIPDFLTARWQARRASSRSNSTSRAEMRHKHIDREPRLRRLSWPLSRRPASARVLGPNPGLPEPGGSQRTLRWRKADSNRWSLLEKGRAIRRADRDRFSAALATAKPTHSSRRLHEPGLNDDQAEPELSE